MKASLGRAVSSLRHLTPADVAALAVITATTLHLVARDGGRNPGEVPTALVVVSLGTLVLLPGLRRVTRPLALLLAALAAAPLVAVAFAEVRAGMARPLVAWAFVPGVALATIHLWRRPWGRQALGAILLLAALRSWYSAFLAWWGNAGARPSWLALSWHNQAGTLMGAFGVAATAMAAWLHGRARYGLAVLAGACLAGAWLSGSRGAVVATAVGLLAVLVSSWGFRRSLRQTAEVVGAVALVAIIAVIGLEAMTADQSAQPLTGRDESAVGNMTARFGHWEGAAGMAASRPLTGWGPGSYRWASRPFYPTDTNLTSSAHNEYIEVLGESGLVGAAPVWLAAVGIGWLALGALRRRRSGAVVAAAGAATVLGLHAAIDFDWDYPVLLALLAISGSVLWADRHARRTAHHLAVPVTDARAAHTAAPTAGGPRLAGLVATAFGGMAIMAGLTAGIAAANAPGVGAAWDFEHALGTALSAAQEGDITGAREAVERARTWNPGAPSLPVIDAIVEHAAGELTDGELAGTIDADHAVTFDHLRVAGQLLAAGAVDEAGEVLDRLAPELEVRRRWGVEQPVTVTVAFQLGVRAERDGCAAAEEAAPELLTWAATFDVEPSEVAAVLAWHEQAPGTRDCGLSARLGG